MVLPLQKQSNLAQGLPKKDDKEEPAMEKAKEITTEVKQEIKEAAAEAATKLRPKVQLVGLRETIWVQQTPRFVGSRRTRRRADQPRAGLPGNSRNRWRRRQKGSLPRSSPRR
jgi:hypothetical protein